MAVRRAPCTVLPRPNMNRILQPYLSFAALPVLHLEFLPALFMQRSRCVDRLRYGVILRIP